MDDNGENQQLDCAHPDPFLRSMAYWQTGDYISSLKTLLLTKVGQDHPSFQESVFQENQSQNSSK